ncbi:1-acyl-sn-glycerol-3-phosphate acyltransferase-like protein, partial [Trifolium medium]|nr:1-acyl-sn-glycerol-3-phosphate acyltransferase-like protein [Trifolium medium]
SGIKRLSDFPLPFWLALFVEGTRFTQVKLLAAQEYATSTGLPVPRNVLIPRTKVFGFMGLGGLLGALKCTCGDAISYVRDLMESFGKE